eukprot:NODE_2501_length_526_cov_134.477987_g1987_i0.p1 GENE.NODE_2501_length_526_cov_134.477987_g1987_i0~~NODE_2501_length_526_cov_134.477987_g1987_i0.p1  ORF type:complete len:61 (-),score=3.61 NODE_2501_length_526_cov_134.477987_g1987_i0:224-406(-)
MIYAFKSLNLTDYNITNIFFQFNHSGSVSHTMCMLVGSGDKLVVGATHSVLDAKSDNKQQ